MALREPATSVVRVLGAEGTVGTGFLVNADGRLVATCAHVVEFARGKPDGEVEVAFHATGDRMAAYVEPAYWRASAAEDVAMLRLRAPVPDGVPAVHLGTSRGSTDHPFRTFGFPPVKSQEGLTATGTITDRNEAGQPKLQLSNASEVAVGFSGAPLLDTAARRVVGMVVEILAPDQGRFFQTAFGVPSETLVEICPELAVSDLCPYRALHAFDEADAEFFFGRSDAVNRMLSALHRNPSFLAVFGPSGSGKSSLVRAGLVPRLCKGGEADSDRWGIVITRPADLADLERQVPGVTADATAAARTWLSGHRDRTRLALLIDQFEEVFVVLDDQTRARFLASLGAAAQSTAPVSIVLTMRDEFYSRFVREAPALGRALEGGLRNIPPQLTRRELTDIVEQPAALLRLPFDPDLVTRIVNDAIELSPGQGVDTAANTVLPLLELTLTQLWEGARDGVLSHATYEKNGRLTGGIARWADGALDRLGEPAQPLARRVLTALVHLGDESQGTPDSRRRRTIASLARHEGELAEVGAVVGRLADGRLVITAEDSVELIHDALLREWGRLQGWLNEDRRFLTWQQDIERQRLQWVASGPEGARDEGRLLHGHDLQVARDFRVAHALELADPQHAYIAESLAVWEREQRRLHEALGEAQRQRAIAETRLAAANLREQAARVLTLLPLEPVAGLALAADAMIRNLAELPEDLVSSVQVSLHAALRLARERHLALGHTATVTAVAVDPRGQCLLSASADRTIRRWSLDGEPVGMPWSGHDDAVTAIAIDPRGEYVVSAGADRTIRRWSLDGEPVGMPWSGHDDAVTAIAIDPRGEYVVSAGADRTIRRWSLDGEPVGMPWSGHDDAVTAIAIDPRGEYVVSAGADRTIRRWSLDGEPVGMPWSGHDDAVTAIAIDQRGRFVVSASADRTIRQWSPDGQPIGTPWTGHNDAVTAIAIDPHGRYLASACADHTLRIWDWQGRPARPPVVGHRDPPFAVAFTPDAKTLVSGGADRSVRIWERDGYAATSVFEGHTGDVNGVVLLDGDRRIVSASADGTLREWTRQGKQVGPPWQGHENFVYHLARDSTGQRLASASADGTVRLWDALAGTPLGEPVRHHRGPVHAVCFSPDGNLLASGGADATVRLFRPDGTAVGQPLRGHEDEVWAVAFSPDGSMLASAGLDATVRLWRPNGHPLAGPLRGHEQEIRDLAFAPDGTWFVTASPDRTLRRWTADGISIGEPLHGHADGVWAVAVSHDGRFIASGSADATLRLWDLDGNPVSEPLEGHDGPVWRVAVGGDGRLLVSAGSDGTLRTWDVGWRAWLEQACRRLSGHPGPAGEYAATAAAVREACDRKPWLTPVGPAPG